MEQKCFFAGCKKRVSIVCHCQQQVTYCCSPHIGKHTKNTHDHNIVNLKKSLTKEESQEISVKAMRGLRNLMSLKRNIRNKTLEIINQVTSTSHKALKMIKNAESMMKGFLRRLIFGEKPQ